ncbi:hypothetical protein PF010_g11717 [Phytophthora fragariae]|uniref:Uncharacterized protein n=1 Tax=Phytophthora fragariae TaxID=53985 RepID=A0A6A3U882_9STRA|nr:hypothetical protein PF009_g13364 [Phytophthora fragariae]KAE9007307.1 hypothetical protein PF011_g11174 [Phytophthora fragariae]KAE9108935.1 hypothetical protein PF010_g11717 [Phytophthora fragariae]KAE9108987.1 hypothetical protein PF007_g12430 [Phytophthora fragariae]KAE9143184.1 hypothetical protein PF006_g11763 [Phytophthora fragariae]
MNPRCPLITHKIFDRTTTKDEECVVFDKDTYPKLESQSAWQHRTPPRAATQARSDQRQPALDPSKPLSANQPKPLPTCDEAASSLV